MEKTKVLGALVGDIIGSVYEFNNTKSTDFELFCEASRFTDDSVMTLAVAKWLVLLLPVCILYLMRLQSGVMVF